VKFLNSALYGGIAPWAFYDENELRTFSPLYSDPYTHGPGTENLRNIARLTAHALLVMEGGEESDVFCYPYNNRWEIAYSEFADGHDGVYCNGTSLRMHDNWIGNMEDDAIYLSSPTPGVCDDIHIYKNFITGCTTAFGCCGRGTTKGSIFVYGNVVDFRNGIHFKRATPENPTGIIQSTNFLLVHGTRNMRTIESLYFYHNTAVLSGKLRSYLGNTLANTMPGSTRHVANNLFFYLGGYPQIRTEKQPGEDVWIDGNVHWSQAAEQPADWLKPVRDSAGSELSKKYYPGGWEAHSKLAAPEFVSFSESPDAINDYRLQPGTALETAQPLPKTPVLEGGVGGAQAGAFQQGEAAARVGVDKRILVGFPAK
jgi:hypothetical protein